MVAAYAETFRQSIIGHAFPHGTARCYSYRNRMFAEGRLPVTTAICEKAALIQVSFCPQDWMTTPPRVVAEVDWIQPCNASDWENYAEWHRYPTGELCWTRPDQWHSMTSDDPRSVVDRMAASLVKDVTVLLSYHLLAYSLGITKWQHQWPFYRHGSYKGGINICKIPK